MKEPARTNAANLAAVTLAWLLCAPQALPAQRPYPPPKTNRATTQPNATAIGGNPRATNGAAESSRNDEASEIAAVLLRRRLAAELAEDFDRLGRINREKIVPLSSSTNYDYKELSQTAGEINKRAKRIKSNSPLPLKEKKVETAGYALEVADAGTLLLELSRLIDRFLGSSIFRVTSVNDDELRAAAGRDLEGIIRLSDTINKIAKRLAKASTRSA